LTTNNKPHAWVFEFVSLGAIWGASFLFMRLGANDFGPVATAFLRVALAACFMVPWLIQQGHWEGFKQAGPKVLLVGVINSAIPFVLFSYAVLHINTGLAGILNAATPLFGAAVAWAWLGDKPPRTKAFGLAVGFAGVAMLAWNKASFKPGGSGWAVVACLGATFCYGVAASYSKRFLQGISPVITATGSQVGASLALVVPAAFLWPSQWPGAKSWAALLALALLCTAVAYWLYFKLMQEAGPERALAVTFVIPVFALTYGAIFLAERIGPWELLSAGVIVLGTALATGLLKVRRASSNTQ
jgi:drug/metabolite transporter (DMT)-like permease